MIVVDTSVWIEFFKGKNPYYESLATLLVDRQILGLPCVFGELLQGAKNKRASDIIIEFWKDLPRIEPARFEAIWIETGLKSSHERWYAKGIGLIDATILLVAFNTKSKIWSLDKGIKKVAKQWRLEFVL